MTDEMKKAVSKAIARKYKLDKYADMMGLYKNGDGISNEKFQTLFNSYFDVRRDDKWKKDFYKIFVSFKGTTFSKKLTENCKIYNGILKECFKKLKTTRGNDNPVEASFSSKMLAVINPDMPILDSQVMANMGLGEITGKTPNDKCDRAAEVYNTICERYEKYLGSEECKSAVTLFDTIFPESIFSEYDYKKFTVTKKIDWFLWALTSDELEEIGLFEGLIK